MSDNIIEKVDDKTIRITFARPLSHIPKQLIFVIGWSKSGKVIVDTKTDKIVGIECRPEDWYDFIREKASKERVKEYLKIVKELGFNIDFTEEE